jgi:hypothetical protein
MDQGMMLVLLLLAAEGAAAAPVAPLPPHVVTGCAAMYGTGPNGQWCLRRAAEAAAEDRELQAKLQAAAAAGRKQRDEAVARHEAEMAAEAEQGLAKLKAQQAERNAETARQESERLRKEIEEERAASTPEAMQFSLSAQICDRQADRAEALAAIKKERRYSKIGGVVHLGRLGELQDDVASADEDVAGYRAELKAIGRKALSCKYVAANRAE